MGLLDRLAEQAPKPKPKSVEIGPQGPLPERVPEIVKKLNLEQTDTSKAAEWTPEKAEMQDALRGKKIGEIIPKNIVDLQLKASRAGIGGAPELTPEERTTLTDWYKKHPSKD